MLLAIEIMLTISAWKRGWKGFALIPGIVALFMGFILGATATSEAELMTFSLIFDGLLIAILIGMNIARRGEKVSGGESTHEPVVDEKKVVDFSPEHGTSEEHARAAADARGA